MLSCLQSPGLQRLTDRLARVLPFGLALFILGNFLPVSAKTLNNLFYGLCALPAVLWFLARPAQMLELFNRLSLFWWLLLCVLLGGYLSAFGTAAPKSVLYIALLTLVVSYLWLQDQRMLRRLFLWLGILSVLLLLWATWFWLTHKSGMRLRLWRDMHPIRMALLAGSGLAALGILWLLPRLEVRGALWRSAGLFVLLLALAWCSVVFQSRSLLLGAGVLFFCELLMGRRPWLPLAAVVLLGGVVVALGWHEILLRRGLSYRLDIWQEAWHRIHDVCGMVIGCGDDDYQFIGRFPHPHSAYFSMWYYYGLLPFLMTLAGMLWLLVQGVRLRSSWLLVAGIGWGGVLTTTGGVIHSPEPYWVYFWMPTLALMLQSSGMQELGSASAVPAEQYEPAA